MTGWGTVLQVHYIADSETEQVEWFSALEGAVAKIVRAVAGLEEEEQAPAVNNSSSNSGRDRDWANQLEKGFASMSKSSSSRPNDNAMVNVVGYSGGGGGGGVQRSSSARRSDSFAADNGNYGGSISYGQIAGEASHSLSTCTQSQPLYASWADKYHIAILSSVQLPTQLTSGCASSVVWSCVC